MMYSDKQKQHIDRLAPPMFVLSLLYLILLAALIVVMIDIPRVAGLASIESAQPSTQTLPPATGMPNSVKTQALKSISSASYWLTGLLLLIWPLFIFEYLVTRWVNRPHETGKSQALQAITCLVPPLRLAAPASARGNQIWLPGLKWRPAGRHLSMRLERLFGKPMLIIALLILPILLIEYGLRSTVEKHDWLMMLMHISTGFIWYAFAIEFIIMVSATDKKLAYVKKNWIDLAIILLPLISFLRSIRVLRLARLAKVQKLAKLGRVYRMRGLGMKALRALMLLQFVNRLLRNTPQKTLAKLKLQHKEKLLELNEIEDQIQLMEADLTHSGKRN